MPAILRSRRKENYRKWLGEGLTYRLGDILIGLCAGAIVSITSFLIWRTPLDLAFELGAAFAVTENLLNTGWYWANRYLWSLRDKPEA